MDEFEFGKGTAADRSEIVDFGNYVFSHDHGSTDFPTLLPRLYGPEADTSGYHYLAKKDGRIVAMIGAFPFRMSIMGQTFRACGIGTVSVHPYCRGRGLMKLLLKTAVEDMRKSGIAFTTLSGQRQRYEYFGYEPCGVLINFLVSQKNIRHYYRGRDFAPLTFLPLKPDDAESLHKAMRLHERQPLRVLRSEEEFEIVCRSWYETPFLIQRDGRFCGYLVCSSDRKTISELELEDAALLPDALEAYLSSFSMESVNYSLPPFAKDQLQILEAFSEAYSIDVAHSFRIFDYKNLIRQLLLLKATYAKLANGRLILKIGEDRPLAVEVDGQKISVEETAEQPDISLEPLKAMRFLLSPMSAFFDYAPECENLAASWFPLPLSLLRSDET